MKRVIGHERVVSELRSAIDAGRLPHALLFVGPEGVGKGTLALELAQTLTCVGDDPPCGRCVHCHQIEIGSHPDVTVIERPEGRTGILIEQVRNLREDASLRPYQAAKKVYIIRGAEALTLPAADALLKTLEEPPSHVTIVLTAADVESVPPTVASRCATFTLRSVPVDRIASLLEGEIGAVDAHRIARLARGNVGWALQASRQRKLVEQQEETLSRLSQVPDLDTSARLRLAESLAAERKDRSPVRKSVELLLLLARDLLFVGQGLAPQTATENVEETLRAQARGLSLPQIEGYIERIRVTMERIDANVDPRLSLEALLVSAP